MSDAETASSCLGLVEKLYDKYGKPASIQSETKTDIREWSAAVNSWHPGYAVASKDGKRLLTKRSEPISLYERALKKASDLNGIVVPLYAWERRYGKSRNPNTPE